MGEVVRSVMPILRKHGLVLMQPVTSEAGMVGVETILIHAESGEYISVKATLETQAEKGKSFMQVAGSAVSYLRRYGIISALVLYSDEEVVSGAKANTRKAAAPRSEAEQKTAAGTYAGNGQAGVYKFSSPEIVTVCSGVWKCTQAEAAQTLFAHEDELPAKQLTVEQAKAWAAKLKK
ncbi:hypothetical protein CCP3SC15_2590005 [Gammaproteobacteria bacterium]